jgi:hypothetical protein
MPRDNALTLNDRQHAYLQAIFDTDQAVEADMQSTRIPRVTRHKPVRHTVIVFEGPSGRYETRGLGSTVYGG